MKRLLDITLASSGLLMLSPLMIILAVMVYTDLGKPIFFRQKRAGKHSKPFRLAKFRTMKNKQTGVQELPDSDRLTKLGRLLRASSLDELPGLWNVITGDMSLVGPRPLLLEYVPLYTKRQNRRHEIRPGITGWAQINGRNLINWEEKFELDIWYVENRSLFLDISILLMTLKKVIRREGITTADDSIMPKFTGSEEKSSNLPTN